MAAAEVIHVVEPAGARSLSGPLTVGGSGARIVVPGAADGAQLRIEATGTGHAVLACGEDRIAINGAVLAATATELRSGDVLALGAARIVVDLGAGGLQLDVRHLVGNDTVAPLRPPPVREAQDEDDIDIVAADMDAGTAAARAAARSAAESTRGGVAGRGSRWLWWAGAAAALLAGLLALLSQLQRVPLDVQPRAASVRATGTLLSWQSGNTLFVMAGRHTLRAELEGYEPLQRALQVRDGWNETQRLRLAKLPGLITIDTGGIAAEVAVDGAVVGRVPGVLRVPAGPRTFTVRAARHLPAVARLEVEGAGVAQTLKVVMRSSWGKVRVESSTPGALVSADDGAAQPAPAALELEAGAHRIRIAAPGAKTWESTVIVAAGNTTRVGPILLGAPDAMLSLRSSPAGADVTVSGVFKGRTPLIVPLPAGVDYEIALAKPGYAPWSRQVSAVAGAKPALQATLAPVLVALTVAGEPADAELVVDGVARGKLPQTLQLTATSHAVEVRKAGLQTFATTVDLAARVARSLDYRLIPQGRAADWTPPAERVTARLAGAMRLVAPTSFQMGSERREQGRRPNETLRKVTFSRPFYIGVREVTNGEFRRFRADHRSGFLGKQSLDLDNQPVSSVSFDDAASYCNWLSREEGLPEAYESRGGRMMLKQPATTGYRLPTEAEWEYAARYTVQGLRRYEWGNALPWPAGGIANLAGAETGNAEGEMLRDYRDDHAVAAPVARYPANALGLHDMGGNVAEWVNDRYASYLDTAAATDPQGPDAGRATAVRGASWRTAGAASLRLATRDSAEAARDDLGFRLARYAE